MSGPKTAFSAFGVPVERARLAWAAGRIPTADRSTLRFQTPAGTSQSAKRIGSGRTPGCATCGCPLLDYERHRYHEFQQGGLCIRTTTCENLVFLRRFLMLRLRLAHSRLPADLGPDPVDCSEQACFSMGLACHPAGSPQSEKTRCGCGRGPRCVFRGIRCSRKLSFAFLSAGLYNGALNAE